MAGGRTVLSDLKFLSLNSTSSPAPNQGSSDDSSSFLSSSPPSPLLTKRALIRRERNGLKGLHKILWMPDSSMQESSIESSSSTSNEGQLRSASNMSSSSSSPDSDNSSESSGSELDICRIDMMENSMSTSFNPITRLKTTRRADPNSDSLYYSKYLRSIIHRKKDLIEIWKSLPDVIKYKVVGIQIDEMAGNSQDQLFEATKLLSALIPECPGSICSLIDQKLKVLRATAPMGEARRAAAEVLLALPPRPQGGGGWGVVGAGEGSVGEVGALARRNIRPAAPPPAGAKQPVAPVLGRKGYYGEEETRLHQKTASSSTEDNSRVNDLLLQSSRPQEDWDYRGRPLGSLSHRGNEHHHVHRPEHSSEVSSIASPVLRKYGGGLTTLSCNDGGIGYSSVVSSPNGTACNSHLSPTLPCTSQLPVDSYSMYSRATCNSRECQKVEAESQRQHQNWLGTIGTGKQNSSMTSHSRKSNDCHLSPMARYKELKQQYQILASSQLKK